MSNNILIAGGGGFIGSALARALVDQGKVVTCVDIKPFDQWCQLHADVTNICADLQQKDACFEAVEGMDVVYNLACNMGGMGFIESNKALCMLSVLINTHLLMAAKEFQVEKYFFASSACVYPDYLQSTTDVIALKEASVYPAMPEDGYGWEKLFGERMCQNFHQDFGLDVRIARFHNVYGPWGAWDGGREKAPAAITRKVIEAIDNGSNSIEVWGDGEQTRSFMYIDDCLEGMRRLMESDVTDPINIGRSEMVSINQLIDTVATIAGGVIQKNYKLDAPLGVRGRNSDNTMILEKLDWQPSIDLKDGMQPTYAWIKQQWAKKKEVGHGG